jgi:hypothetical protein
VDDSEYELDKFKCNKRTITPKNGDVYVEYSGSASFKKKTIDTQKTIETMMEGIFKKFQTAKAPVVKSVYSAGGNTLIFPLFDVHVGKRSECGKFGFEELYNHVIASFKDLLVLNSTVPLKKIYIAIDGDFLNSDNKIGMTTKGTIQTNTDPWDEMFTNGCMLLKDLLAEASDYAPVELILCGGNHAHMSTYHCAKTVEAFYHKTPQISFKLGTTQRVYIEFGTVLVGLSHGDKEGKRIVSALISEKAESFGKATFRCVMTGHLHMSGLLEDFKVMHIRVGSPAVKDDFHSGHGYLGAYRKIESFLFNDEFLISRNMRFI